MESQILVNHLRAAGLDSALHSAIEAPLNGLVHHEQVIVDEAALLTDAIQIAHEALERVADADYTASDA
jgi:hypothetical protein